MYKGLRYCIISKITHLNYMIKENTRFPKDIFQYSTDFNDSNDSFVCRFQLKFLFEVKFLIPKLGLLFPTNISLELLQ